MVKFLVCFELLAIGFSQWIGKYTYEAQGPSPVRKMLASVSWTPSSLPSRAIPC